MAVLDSCGAASAERLTEESAGYVAAPTPREEGARGIAPRSLEATRPLSGSRLSPVRLRRQAWLVWWQRRLAANPTARYRVVPDRGRALTYMSGLT